MKFYFPVFGIQQTASLLSVVFLIIAFEINFIGIIYWNFYLLDFI